MNRYSAITAVSAVAIALLPSLGWAASNRCNSEASLLNTSVNASQLKPLFAPEKNLTSTSTVGELQIKPEQLNELETTLTTYQVSGDGKLDVVVGQASASGNEFLTIYSFKQYLSDGGKKYGISIEMRLHYISKSGSISLSNLFGFLSASGNANKFDGSISLSVHGIGNTKTAALLPMPSKLDDSAAALYFSYMGTLKSLITDQGTQILPVILSECL
ncbi:hypothetical protein PIN31009_04741 [Pandoraea iniqua]|uniref:Lipoprotein n=1 Tax=Pandoraea iniqua TaxID=2508288 RepID=A0A5E4YVG5_9BURK|nr:hypothetical protein [Pandoraea iniqua]VVE52377.1 hypothetical protein PIN31009_04741 [Pandoraea iniqua]VVE54576.1 hypothetical protein PIN31115_04915 [Pandoraea iniqua]